ncbi:hypothetical protein [Ochrobactrum sp. 3-3]|uniref:hypothetical protein n=1 Tax=Ochrobactrum sp. 3-3 TaxID=1830124 RepID=UPI000DEF89E3|nr:hypothetical protein [Ochrobactrum sp. 3-3]
MVTISGSSRQTPYQPTTPTNAFPVGFPIFDNDDLQVVANGEVITAYTVTATYVGGVSTDAVVNITGAGITGDVLIKGNRIPRRTDQYRNGAPLKIDDHNYSLNRIEITLQELYRESGDLSGGLQAERAERIAGDAALHQRIDEEETSRIAGDAANAAALATETAERQAADDALHQQIDGIIPTVAGLTARAEAAAESSEAFAGAAQQLVQDATAGFQGFVDGIGYDFGFITQSMTYFDRDFGSITDPVVN